MTNSSHFRRFYRRFNAFPTQGPGHSVLFAALGFGFAGVAGMVAATLLFRLGLVGAIISLISQAQPGQRLLVAILLFVLSLALSGAVTGGIGGWLLSIVDPLALRRRYVIAGAATFAIAQTIIVTIMLLLLSVLGIYYNNIDSQTVHYVLLFGIFGLAYGVVVGLIFGFSSVGFKYGWSVLLAAMVGGMFGGVLSGWLLKIFVGAIRIGDSTLNFWLIFGLTVLFFMGVGAPLGWLYAWFNRQRLESGDLPLHMTLFWRVIVIFAAGMLFLQLSGGIFKVYQFVGLHQPSTSTVIAPETIGTAWSEPRPIPGTDGAPLAPDLASSSDGRLALVWTSQDATRSDVLLNEGPVDDLGQVAWGTPVTLSSPDIYAQAPRVVADDQGNWLVVWQEGDPTGETAPQIVGVRCSGSDCTEPQVLSRSAPDCARNAGAPSHPVIAIDKENTLLVVWQTENGPLMYAVWPADAPPAAPACLPFEGTSPQLTAVDAGQFVLAFQSDADEVVFALYRNNAWVQHPLWKQSGHDPVVFYGGGDRFHTAWCGNDNRIHYWASKSYNIAEPEKIEFPRCSGRPSLVQDGDGRLHILWYSDQIRDNFGKERKGRFLFDSIRTEDGWSEPFVAARTQAPTIPAVIPGPTKAMYLAWAGADLLVWQSAQPHYACPESTGSIYGDAILGVLTSGQYRPPDARIPFCRNDYQGLLYLPDPVPSFVMETASEYGGFADIAEEIRGARYEVLFTNMEWMADVNEDSPGYVFAEAVTDLYHSLKTHPEYYPRGITVRILLGNYPELATMTWGQQIWDVLDVLKKAGLPELENPELGWKVELANFDGQNPHSHAKFIVIDGRMVTAAGFNYSYLHLNEDHPSGLGVSLVDFGVAFFGPVAQDAVADYDDLWSGAQKVVCPGMNPPRGNWSRYCDFMPVDTTHVPETLLYYPTSHDDTAFSLLRTWNRPESDEALAALIRSSQKTIDIFEVNFSLEVYCSLGIVVKDLCNFDDALPYMEALMDAMEQNGVHIRVLVTDVNMNGIENSVAIRVMRQELARRGLLDQAEFRYYTGRMHGKAFVVDDTFLVVGSQNFHYSAWGDGRGLVEYNIATDAPDAVSDFRRAFDYYWAQSKSAVVGEIRNGE